ncbi:MAG: protein translocase subunit SecF, partial [Actinomycetales bacterium]
MGRISEFGHHLYEGRISFDFVGRRKLWYSISAAIVVLAALAF